MNSPISPLNSTWITCTQKMVNIKSNTSQEHHGDHLHAEKLDKIQHNAERKGDNLHVEEDKNQVKPNPEHHDFHLNARECQDSHVDHLHEEEGKVQIQLNTKRNDSHLHAEEGGDQTQSRMTG